MHEHGHVGLVHYQWEEVLVGLNFESYLLLGYRVPRQVDSAKTASPNLVKDGVATIENRVGLKVVYYRLRHLYL